MKHGRHHIDDNTTIWIGLYIKDHSKCKHVYEQVLSCKNVLEVRDVVLDNNFKFVELRNGREHVFANDDGVLVETYHFRADNELTVVFRSHGFKTVDALRKCWKSVENLATLSPTELFFYGE